MSTPIYDYTMADLRRQRERDAMEELRQMTTYKVTPEHTQATNNHVRVAIIADTTAFDTACQQAIDIANSASATPWYRTQTVQYLLWAAIIGVVAGVIFALSLNGWFS